MQKYGSNNFKAPMICNMLQCRSLHEYLHLILFLDLYYFSMPFLICLQDYHCIFLINPNDKSSPFITIPMSLEARNDVTRFYQKSHFDPNSLSFSLSLFLLLLLLFFQIRFRFFWFSGFSGFSGIYLNGFPP